MVMIIYREVTLPERAEVRKGEASGSEGQKGRKSGIIMFLSYLHTHKQTSITENFSKK